ncbi:MAG: hypothetical protein U9R56_05760 [candidate division Zixibacteria bacterium]|nr:hypothetical protein [candidate division Zixibacteria bacterium]
MVNILGECPVPKAMKYDGYNDGIGAGRACWMVQSLDCKLKVSNRRPFNPCYNCKFYKRVVFEEKEKTKFRYSSAPLPDKALPSCATD